MNKQPSSWNRSTVVLAGAAIVGIVLLIVADMRDDKEITAATAAVNSVEVTGGAPVYRFFSPSAVTIEVDAFGQPLPVYSGENTIVGRGELKRQTITIPLQSDRSIEYKALMQQGDSIVYAWKTDSGDVYYDFHAHDDAGGPDFFTRYAEGEGAAQSGSIVAPYTGQHGWYWLNISEGSLAITLEVAGFYDEIIKIDTDGEE